MADEDIKKITLINEEINDLISTLEKKQRSVSNELINIIIEKNQKILELEKEIEKLREKAISEPSTPTKKASIPSQGVSKVDLTDVLADLGVKEKIKQPEKPTPSPVQNIISSKESPSSPIMNVLTSGEEDSTSTESTPTISRYSGVSVLKKVGGPSKFKPRTSPPPKPETELKPTTVAPIQSEKAIDLLEELKSQISEKTTTHELSKILENIRDKLTEIIGFTSVVRDIGTVSNKLKHAPDLALDSSSIEAFQKKVDEWKSKV